MKRTFLTPLSLFYKNSFITFNYTTSILYIRQSSSSSSPSCSFSVSSSKLFSRKSSFKLQNSNENNERNSQRSQSRSTSSSSLLFSRKPSFTLKNSKLSSNDMNAEQESLESENENMEDVSLQTDNKNSRFSKNSKLSRKMKFGQLYEMDDMDEMDDEEMKEEMNFVKYGEKPEDGTKKPMEIIQYNEMYKLGNIQRPVAYKGVIMCLKHHILEPNLVEYVVSAMEAYSQVSPLDRLELEAMALALAMHGRIEKAWLITLALKSKYELSRSFRNRLMEELYKRGGTRYVARLKLFKVIDDPPRTDSRPRPAFCFPPEPRPDRPRYFPKSDRIRIAKQPEDTLTMKQMAIEALKGLPEPRENDLEKVRGPTTL